MKILIICRIITTDIPDGFDIEIFNFKTLKETLKAKSILIKNM